MLLQRDSERDDAAARFSPAPAKPLVSVVVPCFNQARFLREAVQSVQAQTFANWECLVVDDGSTDQSRQVAQDLIAEDARIRLISQSNAGLSAARNAGLDNSRGAFIQFLDADDSIAPRKFEMQLQALNRTTEIALCTCEYLFYSDAEKRPKMRAGATTQIENDAFQGDALLILASRWEAGFSVPAHCFLFDARLFLDSRIRFDATLANHEDWDCWMQIFALKPRLMHVAQALATYRIHGRSMSRNRARMGEGFSQAIAKQRHIFRDDPLMSRILAEKQDAVALAYRAPGTLRRLRSQIQSGLMHATPRPIKQIIKRLLR